MLRIKILLSIIPMLIIPIFNNVFLLLLYPIYWIVALFLDYSKFAEHIFKYINSIAEIPIKKEVKVYKDRNNNLYIEDEIGDKIRLLDGTKHNGTIVGDFELINKIKI